MLFTRGKARWVEEFVVLYLMGHERLSIDSINQKIYDITSIQISMPTIRNVVYEQKKWGYLSTSNLMYGEYTLTSKGIEYYTKDFEEMRFTHFDTDTVNVNV